ncbi:Ppx/GppA phosphatase family protein [Paenibacillus thalictri]|uniref:Chaperone protein DnaK n=1 Tax=Paenibacillus thalictri TaxID=2527873 RepID=A0A4Q9DP98_9BACL|nr:Ppx/GppA phosphatase family protein [Paenibacillus thalictri]TBL75048.1 Ppx/GppA family phosphatase [Paenibacillus thalictri]
MNSAMRSAFIDIGSNTIRLVIYEQNPSGAFHVIHECKESARLSQKIGDDQVFTAKMIDGIVRILLQFKEICKAYEAAGIRAVATAAIRNAANTQDIIAELKNRTGITVELLSGADEARIGFIGVIHTLDIDSGILIDIGGGSTEVSVFRNRRLLNSVSFPFGAVNTAKRFAVDGVLSAAAMNGIKSMVTKALEEHPWLQEHHGLPLIGLGGTIRSLCKISQRRSKYSLPLTHHYMMKAAEVDEIYASLGVMSAEKRKKVDGLSKDRYDIIIPGLAILHSLFHAARASHYIVSGSGLRDGLFFESHPPDERLSIAERSARNLLLLHNAAPLPHAERVSGYTAILFDALQDKHGLPPRYRLLASVTALLYRIGVAVNYYKFPVHSAYLIAHSRLDGITHRETLLCSLAADYKTKKRTHQSYLKHKDILQEPDLERIARLGSLIQLAAALDCGHTMTVEEMTALADNKKLNIRLKAKQTPALEIRAAEALSKDFKKMWGLSLVIHADPLEHDRHVSMS